MRLTLTQLKTIKAILRKIETGNPVGDYSKLVVLNDYAGITYGAEQVTENGGGLIKLLKKYVKNEGLFSEQLKPYLNLLYDGIKKSKKNRLTNDLKFKNLLIEAAEKDPIMQQTQDEFFEEDYLYPALDLCWQYGLQTPLSALVIYDSCIHSGPGDWQKDIPTTWGTAKLLWRYNNNKLSDAQEERKDSTKGNFFLPEEDSEEDLESLQEAYESEESWISGYINWRLNWLKNHKNKAVKLTTYRQHAFKGIINARNWELDLNVYLHLSRTGKVLRNPFKIDSEVVNQIHVNEDYLSEFIKNNNGEDSE